MQELNSLLVATTQTPSSSTTLAPTTKNKKRKNTEETFKQTTKKYKQGEEPYGFFQPPTSPSSADGKYSGTIPITSNWHFHWEKELPDERAFTYIKISEDGQIENVQEVRPNQPPDDTQITYSLTKK